MLMDTLAILRGTFGNFRPQSLNHWLLPLASIFKDTYHYFERTLWPNCEQCNVNELPRNPSGYFRPLSFTTVTCVSLHTDLYHYLERALSPTCKRYNVNEHLCLQSFGVLSETFDHYRWLLRLASIFLENYTITWNARYRQLVNAIMLMNTFACNPSGYFRKLSTTIVDYFDLRQSS